MLNDWEFYDFDKLEELRDQRSSKYMNLVRKWHKAKEKGDDAAKKKAIQAMSKHKESDKVLKEKAEKVGYYWY